MNDLTIYETLAESWWQAGSPLHLLARMNPARFAYFDPLVGHWLRRVAMRVLTAEPAHFARLVALHVGQPEPLKRGQGTLLGSRHTPIP